MKAVVQGSLLAVHLYEYMNGLFVLYRDGFWNNTSYIDCVDVLLKGAVHSRFKCGSIFKSWITRFLAE